MRETRLHQKLRGGDVVVGLLLMEFGTRGIAKILEYADLDYVIIDMEHSGFGIERVADLIAYLKATGIAPIVRIPENLPHFFAGIFDAGAVGVQVASVETAEEARRIVDAVKYPPVGHRGLGMVAAHTDFRGGSGEYLAAANANTLIIVQIETALGLANVDEIAAVPGIDVLAMGQNDLSHSLGIHGQLEHPKFQAAIVTVAEAAKRHGKFAKIHPFGDEQTARYVGLGFRMLMTHSDVSIFRNAAKSSVEKLRAASASAKATEEKATA